MVRFICFVLLLCIFSFNEHSSAEKKNVVEVPKDTIIAALPQLDTVMLLLKQSYCLFTFDHEIVQWTKEQLAGKENRKASDFKVCSEEITDSLDLTVKICGVQGRSSYMGNATVDDNNMIKLYCWLNPNVEGAKMLVQHKLTYRIRLAKPGIIPTYEIVFMSPWR